MSEKELNDKFYDVIEKGYKKGIGKGEKHVKLTGEQVRAILKGEEDLLERAESGFLSGSNDKRNERGIENAMSLPEIYYFKHIKAGVVQYDNEVVLV